MLISNPRKKYKCSICYQKYSKIEEIRAHIKAIHLAHVTCPLCDKLFANRVDLSNHKKLHFQVTPNSALEENEDTNQASKVKNKERDWELCSSASRENVEVGPPDNHCMVMSLSPFSCHANESESTIKEDKCTTSQDTPCDQLITSAHLLSKHKNLQNSITSNHLPQLREDINECLAKNEKEGGEKNPLSSSTGNIVFVPLWDDWKATSTGATSIESDASAGEAKCAAEQGASVSICNETFVIIPYEEIYYIEMPECTKIPSNLINASLRKHVNHVTHYSQKPKEYNCNVCKKTYDNVEDVQSHIKETHVSILICLLCNEKFLTRTQYLNHSYSHLNSSLASPEGKKHYEGNWGENSLEEIENSITSKSEIDVSPQVSKNKSSKSGKAKEYKCRICQEKYVSVEDIRAHIKRVHLTDLTCTLCNKIFQNKYSMVDHAKVHFGGIPNSTLIQSDDKNGNSSKLPHQNGPEENSLFVNGVSTNFIDCGISASERCGLDGSNQIHDDECHKCDKCNLFFDSASALILHKKTHKKPLYKCGICEFASSSKECVIAHLSQECHSFHGDFNDSY